MLSRNSNCHNFSLGCQIQAHNISRRSKLNNGSSLQIWMVITFHSDVRFTWIIYRDPQNWPRKLSANSNGHNFWLECMIDAHDISRRSKVNNESSREIQIAITFHSDVRFTCIICRDPQNWPWKLAANSNAITFYSNGWSTPMIYWDTQNGTTEALRNSNGYNFSLGCLIQAHNISRHSKLKNESSREIQMVISFQTEVRFRRIIYQDARYWSPEALEKFKWS